MHISSSKYGRFLALTILALGLSFSRSVHASCLLCNFDLNKNNDPTDDCIPNMQNATNQPPDYDSGYCVNPQKSATKVSVSAGGDANHQFSVTVKIKSDPRCQNQDLCQNFIYAIEAVKVRLVEAQVDGGGDPTRNESDFGSYYQNKSYKNDKQVMMGDTVVMETELVTNDALDRVLMPDPQSFFIGKPNPNGNSPKYVTATWDLSSLWKTSDTKSKVYYLEMFGLGDDRDTVKTRGRFRIDVTPDQKPPPNNVCPSVSWSISSNPIPVLQLGVVPVLGFPFILDWSISDDGLPKPPAKVTATWNAEDVTGGGASPEFSEESFTASQYPAQGKTTVNFESVDGYRFSLTADDGACQIKANRMLQPVFPIFTWSTVVEAPYVGEWPVCWYGGACGTIPIYTCSGELQLHASPNLTSFPSGDKIPSPHFNGSDNGTNSYSWSVGGGKPQTGSQGYPTPFESDSPPIKIDVNSNRLVSVNFGGSFVIGGFNPTPYGWGMGAQFMCSPPPGSSSSMAMAQAVAETPGMNGKNNFTPMGPSWTISDVAASDATSFPYLIAFDLSSTQDVQFEKGIVRLPAPPARQTPTVFAATNNRWVPVSNQQSFPLMASAQNNNSLFTKKAEPPANGTDPNAVGGISFPAKPKQVYRVFALTPDQSADLPESRLSPSSGSETDRSLVVVLYPSPIRKGQSAKLRVQGSSTIGSIVLNLYDVSGRGVLTKRLDTSAVHGTGAGAYYEEDMSVDGLSSGVYPGVVTIVDVASGASIKKKVSLGVLK